MPFLQAERATRDLRTRLEWLTLDVPKVTEMCDFGQGLMIGSCVRDRLVRHLAWAAVNMHPDHCIIACHSYDFAERVFDACQERGVEVLFVDRDIRPTNRVAEASILVTVPERLYHLRSFVRDGTLRPKMVFLIDPDGAMFTHSVWEGQDVVRSSAICDFRAACLATGLQVPPILWTCVPADAFYAEAVCQNLGVEALVYLDGGTLRTAALGEQLAAVEVADERLQSHWLDAAIVAARQKSSHLLLVADGSNASNEECLRALAKLRNYPVLQFSTSVPDGFRNPAVFVASGITSGELRDRIDERLRMMNKLIVQVADGEVLFRAMSEKMALYCLAKNSVGTLLVAAAPNGWGAEQLGELFQALQRIDVDFKLPHVASTELASTGPLGKSPSDDLSSPIPMLTPGVSTNR